MTCSCRKPKLGTTAPKLGTVALRQRGFIQLPLIGWLAIGTTALVVGMGIALKVQTSRLEACVLKYEAFVAQVRAEGEAAEKRAKEQEAKDKQAKEKADAENAVNRRRIAELTKRLRDARPSSGQLPPAPPSSRRPDLACFDRAEYQRAYGRFIEGVRGLAGEGTENTIDLDTAKEWAR